MTLSALYEGIIPIDYSRDSRLSTQGVDSVKSFLLKGEKSPQEAFARAALAYCDGDTELAKRIYDYASKGWFMFASPVISNAPRKGEAFKALPISCFLTSVYDNLDSLIEHNKEVAWLSVKGGGVGGHWSNIRAVSDKAPGPIPFMKVVDSEMTAYQQGTVRRGSYAAYLDVSHPDVEEFIMARVATGGDSNRKLFNTHLAVNITDAFMEACLQDATWELKCPTSKEVRSTVKARELWQRILECRFKTGEPYLCFIDTANKALPEALKQKGLRINGSNLCVAEGTLLLIRGESTVDVSEPRFDTYVPIENLVGKEVEVWNGSEWSKVMPYQTSKGSWLTKVTVGVDGGIRELLCTSYHKWYLESGEMVETRLLVKGDKLERMACGYGCPEVISIERDCDWGPTYCLTEPLRNKAVFNGILTGNCNEIYLPTSEDRTAVCCLSSVNLEYFEEWKDTSMVEDLIVFLDNVLQAFIDNCPDQLQKARYSATMERSLGLGAMGFHSYLQRYNIPFESVMAGVYNNIMFKHIKEKAETASRSLACTKGEAPDMVGTGMRNAHLLAVAPNASSSIICNTSPSIEPIKSNAYTHRTRAGSHLVKNQYLERELEKLGLNTQDVWNRIILDKGSVQNVEGLPEEVKEVFKTSFEIDQHYVVQYASDRQKYICQGQSVNLFFPFHSDRAYVNSVHLAAWKKGLKGLYYLRSEANPIAASTVKKDRVALKDGDECLACHG